MKISHVAKIALATFTVYSALQFGQMNYIQAEEKQNKKMVLVEKSRELRDSYNHLEKEILNYIGRLKKYCDEDKEEGWWDKNMDKLYSGAILNEEIGLGFVLYKYRKLKDYVYLVVVSEDRLQTCEPDDKFKMLISDPIITYDKDYMDLKLKEYHEHAEEIYQEYTQRLTDPSQKIIHWDGIHSATNIRDFDLLENGGTLYFGLPYFKKGKGADSLIFILNFKNSEGKLSITGAGNGGTILENPF